MKIKYILILLSVCFLVSFKSNYISEDQNLSALIIKLKYNSYGLVGFGGNLKIKNTETGEILISQSKKGFNPYVIIENIPIGNYKIEEVSIVSGPNVLILTDEPKFSTIKIESAKVYYLGNYITKKNPPLLELHFEISKIENDETTKIYKQLRKKSDKWQNLNIDFNQKLFIDDITNISIE